MAPFGLGCCGSGLYAYATDCGSAVYALPVYARARVLPARAFTTAFTVLVAVCRRLYLYLTLPHTHTRTLVYVLAVIHTHTPPVTAFTHTVAVIPLHTAFGYGYATVAWLLYTLLLPVPLHLYGSFAPHVAYTHTVYAQLLLVTHTHTVTRSGLYITRTVGCGCYTTRSPYTVAARSTFTTFYLRLVAAVTVLTHTVAV